jgi:23S rRNA (pseudouridine1915-N3)-methyltransferase
MRISFYTVGKGHEAYVREGVADFTARVNRYYPCTWKFLTPSKYMDKQEEADTILGALTKDDYLVLLDERGKMWTSEQLSAFIDTRASDSCRHLVFLIGGAFGVDERVRARAQFVWSLSALVFPHQLVRLILSEQVYRACTILRNEKYHHT